MISLPLSFHIDPSVDPFTIALTVVALGWIWDLDRRLGNLERALGKLEGVICGDGCRRP